MKTTCRFVATDVLFLMNNQMLFLPHRESKICKPESITRDGDILNCENTYNRSSRAHAYARITGVFFFLLSQVSHFICKLLLSGKSFSDDKIRL